jgi:hypothetical protein
MSSHGSAKGIKAGGGASAAGTRVSGGACAVAALALRPPDFGAQIRVVITSSRQRERAARV